MKLKANPTPSVEIYGKEGATKRFAKFTKITRSERRR